MHSALRERDPLALPSFTDKPWQTSFSFSEDLATLSVDGQLITKMESPSLVGDLTTNLEDPTNLRSKLENILDDWERWMSRCVAPLFGFQPIYKSWVEQELPSILLRLHTTSIEVYNVWRGHTAHLTNGISEGGSYDQVSSGFEAELFPLVHRSQLFFTSQLSSTSDIDFGSVLEAYHTNIGDELWLLRGGLSPFIMRRTHRLIGPCFLAKYMRQFDRGIQRLNKDEGLKWNLQRVTLI
jgi:hypothetical protein